MIRKIAAPLVAVLVALALGSAAYAQKASPTAKTASEYFVKYHDAMAAAKTVDDIRPFMDADSQKEMDAASKDEKDMGVKMISSMYADITNVKVVKETAKGNTYSLDVTATQASDKQAGTGTVEIVKDGAGWRVESETWKFGSSTMTLKKKKP
jgi:hypothetical protein